MSEFWEIIGKWSPFGQFVFFVIIFLTFCTMIKEVAYYVAVCFRGWQTIADVEEDIDDQDEE